MWSKLLTLSGVLLFVAACETAPDGSAEGAGEGAGGKEVWSVEHEGAGGGGVGAGGGEVGAGGGEVAAVEPTMSSQDKLVQEVGDRVFFDFNKFSVRPDGEETLRRQAQFLKQNPALVITIAGHCDERGTREYNLALGERRANAARNYLISLGIHPTRISTVSYGKERPIVLGHNEAAWAQNRVGLSEVN